MPSATFCWALLSASRALRACALVTNTARRIFEMVEALVVGRNTDVLQCYSSRLRLQRSNLLIDVSFKSYNRGALSGVVWFQYEHLCALYSGQSC